MSNIDPKRLYEWCRIPAQKLVDHPKLKTPFRLVQTREAMGELMARELVELIAANNKKGRPTRAIIPCGPSCWYEPWTRIVNAENVSLKRLTVFHMDECLDWQGRLLPEKHPYNFRTFMEEHFYGGIKARLNVPQRERYWMVPDAIGKISKAIAAAPVDITVGGWGQDGHVAYNQTRRHPYSHISVDDLADSTIRVQDNNLDTIIALAQRTFGAAYQFVPPMSVTLGMRECMSAKKVRIFSDTGAWKQTALRVALFCEPTTEYPMTLLQRHKDALITATLETATHPVGLNPDWELF